MKKGFTLIELLVIVSITGVLVSVVWSIWHDTKRPEAEVCAEKMKYLSVSDLPAYCYKYLDGIAGNLIGS